MKTIDVTNPSEEIAGLLDEAAQDDVLVRLRDGREFVITAVDDFDAEVARTRANEKLMKLLDERAKQPKRIPLEEVKRQFGVE